MQYIYYRASFSLANIAPRSSPRKIRFRQTTHDTGDDNESPAIRRIANEFENEIGGGTLWAAADASYTAESGMKGISEKGQSRATPSPWLVVYSGGKTPFDLHLSRRCNERGARLEKYTDVSGRPLEWKRNGMCREFPSAKTLFFAPSEILLQFQVSFARCQVSGDHLLARVVLRFRSSSKTEKSHHCASGGREGGGAMHLGK